MGYSRGFSLVIESRERLRETTAIIAEAGFDGIEPTFNEGLLPSPSDYPRTAKELKMRCDELGLAVPGLRGGRVPWSTIPSPDRDERRAALEHTRRACECLRILGGDVLLVVPGQARPDVSYADHWSRVVEYGHEASEIAGEFDCVIGLENVEARFPVSIRDWVDLIDEIASPRIRMYLDVGNVTWLGLGYPHQWIRALGSRICRIHFKDAGFSGTLRNLLAGEVDWAAVSAALREIGYSGWISVEPEWYRFAPHRLARRLAEDLEAILGVPTDTTEREVPKRA